MSDDPSQPIFVRPDQPLPAPGDGGPARGAPRRPGTAQRSRVLGHWTPGFGLLATFTGFAATLTILGIASVVYELSGGDIDDSGFIVAGAVVQALIFVGAAWALARTRGNVRARDFGLLRAPVRRAIGLTVAVGIGYLIFTALFSVAVDLKPDETPDQLGAGDGTLGMLGFVFVAVIVAPVMEELFFRGVLFRSLANGIGVAAAAVLSGVLFGLLHWDFDTADRLLQTVPLAVLGIVFALLVVWTGTLYAPLALHASNNALAAGYFAVEEHSTFGLVLTIAVWLAMMAFAFLGPRLTDRDGDEPPGPGSAVPGTDALSAPPPGWGAPAGNPPWGPLPGTWPPPGGPPERGG